MEIEGFYRIKKGTNLRCMDMGRSRACQYVDNVSNRLVGYEWREQQPTAEVESRSYLYRH